MAPQRRPRLIILGLVALLGTGAARADDKKPIDVWVGRWNLDLRFPDEPAQTTWIEIAPDAGNRYVLRTKGGEATEILILTKDLLEFRILDRFATAIQVKLNTPHSFTGTVDQPKNETRPTGAASGKRLHSFGGFFIVGPTRLKWGQQKEYKLEYARDGVRRPWLGEARWRISSQPRRRGMLSGDRRAAVRTLTAPPDPGGFAVMQVRLRAMGIGNELLSSKLKEAGRVVVVTNVPERCRLLAREIVKTESEIRTLRGRLAEIQARMAALRFPEPWKSDTAAALDVEIAKERKAVADLEKNERAAAAAVDRIRRSALAVAAFRRALANLTTDVGRAFAALGWYKRAAPTDENKAGFVAIYTGRRPVRRIQDEFDIAYQKAHRVGVATVGVGLVQIGGLITLISSGGGSSLSGALGEALKLGFSFGLSTYVDKKVDSSAILKSLKISEEAVADLAKSNDQIGRLARRHQAATTAAARNAIEVQMNRAALKALVHATTAENALRSARRDAQQGQRAIRRALRKHRTALAQLEAQKRKESLNAEKRQFEILDAKNHKAALVDSLQATRAELEAKLKSLARLRSVDRQYCAPVAARPGDEAQAECKCRRGRLLASSYFLGGTDGWKITGDGEDFKAIGDHIQARDRGMSRYWHFSAPAKFLGDKRAAYGSVMTFELNQLEHGSPTFGDRILVLSDGKTYLVYTPKEKPPAVGWTRFEVCFHESKGWTASNVKGRVPKELFLAVLQNLKTLVINCEHSTGRDVGGLRSVALYGAR